MLTHRRTLAYALLFMAHKMSLITSQNIVSFETILTLELNYSLVDDCVLGTFNIFDELKSSLGLLVWLSPVFGRGFFYASISVLYRKYSRDVEP